MSRETILACIFVLAWLTVARAVLVVVKVLPPTCGLCGRKFERRHLGELVCRCQA